MTTVSENLNLSTSLSRVVFPVYLLRDIKPSEIDKILFYSRDTESYIIDDKNLVGKTLGERRLQLLSQGVLLYKLKRSVYFLGDLIKLAKTKQWFIDNTGYIFTVKKTKRVPLIFKRIKQIVPIKSGGAIVEVFDIPTRFKCLYVPENKRFAGLLKLSPVEYILYGFYEEEASKNSWRKI